MSFGDLPLFVKRLSGANTAGNSDGPRDVAQFRGPSMAVLDPFNRTNLYVVDVGNRCIRIVDTNSGFVTTFAGNCGYSGYANGQGKAALFNDPIGLLFTADGTIVVADRLNFVLRKISRNGTVSTFSGSHVEGVLDGDAKTARFGSPCGIDLDPSTGNIIVAEGPAHVIRMVFPNGTVTTIAGTGGQGSNNGLALQASFNFPTDVKFDQNGAIFIADSGNSLIRKLVDGVVSTYAGSSPGYRDGDLSVAKFNNGNGMTLDKSGNLIFSDYVNNLIRMINVGNSTMSTIAGYLNPSGIKDGIALKSTFYRPSFMSMDLEADILYLGGTDIPAVMMICSAPCYNGGTYDCLSKVCNCTGKWLPPNCLYKTASSTKISTSLSSSTKVSTSSTAVINASPVDQIDQAVALIVVSSVAGVLFVGILLLAFHRTWKRRAVTEQMRVLDSVKSNPQYKPIKLQNDFADKHSVRSEDISLPVPRFDLEMTITKTFSIANNVVAIPGYCLLNIDTDLNVNNESRLGEGGTANVYKCTLARASLIAKYSFNEVALKIIKTHDQQAIMSIKFEIAIMTNIPPHQNVIQFVGYSDEPVAIVMKYYQISLKELLMRNTEITNLLQFKIAYDIALGMEHIHDSGVLHLDLKPHNILIDMMADRTFNCVVCDFGFANFTKESKKQFVSGVKTNNPVGITPKYAAPEMIASFADQTSRFDGEIHKKIDVYSYAIILYELMSNIPVWQGLDHNQIRDAVLTGKRPDTSNLKFKNPILEEIMIESWNQNPIDRPDFRTVLCKINDSLSKSEWSRDGNNSVTTTGFSSSKSNTVDKGGQ